jgi:predicted AAA+ superfamily ATPase
MTYGGYPAVVMEPDITEKKELLNELKTSFVKRDIYEAGVEKELVFFQLMRLLSEQTGNLVNRNELGSTLKVDSKTVDNYLFVLQKCFHISLIAPFFSNLRKEITKMPKIYFNDLGMRNVLLNNFEIPDNRSDRGALFENLLFIRLCEIHDADNVKFWHTADGKEVDFIVETTNKKGIAYEAKYSGKLFKPNKYNTFKATYPEYPLVTVDLLGEAEATPYLKLK